MNCCYPLAANGSLTIFPVKGNLVDRMKVRHYLAHCFIKIQRQLTLKSERDATRVCQIEQADLEAIRVEHESGGKVLVRAGSFKNLLD